MSRMLSFDTVIAVPPWALLASLLCAWAYWFLVVKPQHRMSTLPSPPGDPILGHLRYMPKMNDRDTVFHEWGRKYGDIFMIHILGKPIVVINSEKAARELMEKRSVIYSDRPTFPLLERIGWENGALVASYGPGWTTQRRMMQRPMIKTVIPEYRHVQEQEADVLLRGLLEQPAKYTESLRRYTAGILVAMIYGHRIRSFDDEWYRLAKTVDKFHPSLLPSLMDISPYFEYLPSWFPGAWFKDYLRETKPIVRDMMRVPLERVWKEVVSGTVSEPSYASHNLEAMQKDGVISDQDWWNVEMTCSQQFVAGLDTSYQTSHWFILCVLQHPEVQAKAQREIDSVIGRDRLPSFDDRDSLPYVQCVMNELMRCYLVSPLGVPHKSTSEDIYEGMRIPKGATIIVNSRGLALDEHNFHDPHEFKPERFLPKPAGAGENFSMMNVFGWGRRICPGRHLADANTWLLIARILATFTITKAKDADGKPIEPILKCETGLVRYPEPFVFDIHPRDDKASSLIKNLNLNT